VAVAGFASQTDSASNLPLPPVPLSLQDIFLDFLKVNAG